MTVSHIFSAGFFGMFTCRPVGFFKGSTGELDQRRDIEGRQDLKKGARTAMRALVSKDLADTLAKSSTSDRHIEPHDDPVVSELLALETQIKAENAVLAVPASQARAATVGFIAQIVDVPTTSIPLLKEILGEMINTSAEILPS